MRAPDENIQPDWDGLSDFEHLADTTWSALDRSHRLARHARDLLRRTWARLDITPRTMGVQWFQDVSDLGGGR
jgi:hypothetical protein